MYTFGARAASAGVRSFVIGGGGGSGTLTVGLTGGRFCYLLSTSPDVPTIAELLLGATACVSIVPPATTQVITFPTLTPATTYYVFGVYEWFGNYYGVYSFGSFTTAGASYPPASSIPMLLRYDSANGAQTGLVNSGSLGGTYSTSGTSSAVTTGVSKFGTGSMRLYRQFGTTGTVHYQNAALYAPLGTSLTCGMWIYSSLPGGSAELRNYEVRVAGDDFTNSFSFRATINPSSFGLRVAFFNPGAGPGGANITASVALVSNTWHYLEGCIDGPSNTGYVFYNGVLVASGNVGTNRPAAMGGATNLHGSYGSTYANNATEFVAVDNVFSIPGVCVHTADFVPPGDFT